MSKAIETNFLHRIGPVVICTGIGDTMYGAYAVKPNGSLKRLQQIEQDKNWTMVSARLDMYKGKTIWRKP
ncbi:MAG: hypothetical protein LLF76_00285 [Planctomycetaceae bacterium]|nr:hypothetical protein [Planctomycetaceae bacterium]